MLLRTFFLSVIFLGYMIFYADSRGVLTIRLLNFENKKGRTYDGSCCDHTPLDGASCPDQCDYVMRLIVSGLGRANDHVFLFHRPLKYDANDISFQDEATDMVLTILFDEWPKMGHVKMNAFFYDYDDYDHTTLLVDWFENELTRTVNKGNYQRGVVKGNRQSDKTSLEFEWSVHCFTANDCLKPPPEWKSWPWEQKEQQTVSGTSFPKSTSEKTPTTTMDLSRDVVAHQWNNGKWKMSSVAPDKQVVVDSPAIGGSDTRDYWRRKNDIYTKRPTGYAEKSSFGSNAIGSSSRRSSFSLKNRKDQSSYSKKSPFANSGHKKINAVVPSPSVKLTDRDDVADKRVDIVSHSTGIKKSAAVKGNGKWKLDQKTHHGNSPFKGPEEKTNSSPKPKMRYAISSTTDVYQYGRNRKKASSSDSMVSKNLPWSSSTLTRQWMRPQSTSSIIQQRTPARSNAPDIRSSASPTISATVYTITNGLPTRTNNKKGIMRPFTPATTTEESPRSTSTRSQQISQRKLFQPRQTRPSHVKEQPWTTEYNTVSTIKSDLPRPESSDNMKTSIGKTTSGTYSVIRAHNRPSSRMHVVSTVDPAIRNTSPVPGETSPFNDRVSGGRLEGRKRKHFGGKLKSRYQLMNSKTHKSKSRAKLLANSPTVKEGQQSNRRHKAVNALASHQAKMHDKVLSAGDKSKDRETMKPFQPWSRSRSTFGNAESTTTPHQFELVTRQQKGHTTEGKQHKLKAEPVIESSSTRNKYEKATPRFVSEVDTTKNSFNEKMFPKTTGRTLVEVTHQNLLLHSTLKSPFKPVTEASVVTPIKKGRPKGAPIKKGRPKEAPIKKGHTKGAPTFQPSSITVAHNKNSVSPLPGQLSVSTSSRPNASTVRSPFQSVKYTKQYPLQEKMVKNFKHAVQENIRKYVSSIATPPDFTVHVNDKAGAIHSDLKATPSSKSPTGDDQWRSGKMTSTGKAVTATPAGPAWTHFTRWWQRAQTTPALQTPKVIPAGANEGKVFNIVDGFKRRKERKRVQHNKHSPFRNIQKNKSFNHLGGSRSKVNTFRNTNSRRRRIMTPTHATTKTTRQTSFERPQVTTHNPVSGTRWVWQNSQARTSDKADKKTKNGLYTQKRFPGNKTDKKFGGMTAPDFEKTMKTRGRNPYTKNTTPADHNTTPRRKYIQVSTSKYRITKARGWKSNNKSSTKIGFAPKRNEYKAPQVKYSTTPISQTKKWSKYSTERIPQTTRWGKHSTRIPQITRWSKYSTTPIPQTTKWSKSSTHIARTTRWRKYSAASISQTRLGKYSTTPIRQTTKWEKYSTTPIPQTRWGKHSTTRIPQTRWGKYSTTLIPRMRWGKHSTTRIPQTRGSKHSTTRIPQTRWGKHSTTRIPQTRGSKHSTTRTPQTNWGKYSTASIPRRRWGKHSTTRIPQTRWGKHSTTRIPQTKWGKYSTTPLPQIRWGKHSTTRIPQTRWGKYSTTPIPQTRRWGKYTTTRLPEARRERYSTTPIPQTMRWDKDTTTHIPQTRWGKYSTTPIPKTTRWGTRKIRTRKTDQPSTVSLIQDVRTNVRYDTKPQYPITTRQSKWSPPAGVTRLLSTSARQNYREKASHGRLNIRLDHEKTTAPSTTKIWHYMTDNKNLPPAQTTNIWQGLMSTRVITRRRTIDMGTQPTQKTSIELKKLPKLNRWNEGAHKKENRLVHMSKTRHQTISNVPNSNRQASSSTRNVVTPLLKVDMRSSVTPPGVKADISNIVTRWWQRRKSSNDESGAQQSKRTAKTTSDNRNVTQPSPSVRSTRWWERKVRKETTVPMSETTTVIATNHKGKATTHIPKPTRWWQRKRSTSHLSPFQSTTSTAVKSVTPVKASVNTRWWQRRKGQTTVPTLAKNKQAGLTTTRRFTKLDSIVLRPTKWWQRRTTAQQVTATRSLERMSKDFTRETATRPTLLRTRSWMRRKTYLPSSLPTQHPVTTQSSKLNTKSALGKKVYTESSSKAVSKEELRLMKSDAQTKTPVLEHTTKNSVTRWWERRRPKQGIDPNKAKPATQKYHPTTIAIPHSQQTVKHVTKWSDKHRRITSTRAVTYPANSNSKHISKTPVVSITTTMLATDKDANQSHDIITAEKVESRTKKKTKTWNIFEFLPDVLNKMYSGESIHETDDSKPKSSITSAAASNAPSSKSRHRTVTENSGILKTRYFSTRMKSSMPKSSHPSSTLKNLRMTTPRKLSDESKNWKSKMTTVTVTTKPQIKRITWLPTTTKIYSSKFKKTVKKQYHPTTSSTSQMRNTDWAKSITKSKNRVYHVNTTPHGTMHNTRGKTLQPRNSMVLSTTAATKLKSTITKATPKGRYATLSDIKATQNIGKDSSHRVTKQSQTKLKVTLLSDILRTSTKSYPATPGRHEESRGESRNKPKTTGSDKRKKLEKPDKVTKSVRDNVKKTMISRNTMMMKIGQIHTTMKTTQKNETIKNKITIKTHSKNRTTMKTARKTTTMKTTQKDTKATKSDPKNATAVKTARTNQPSKKTPPKTTTLKTNRKTTIKYKTTKRKLKPTTIKPKVVKTKSNKSTAVGNMKDTQRNKKITNNIIVDIKKVTEKKTGIIVDIKKVTEKKTGVKQKSKTGSKTTGIKIDFKNPIVKSNDSKIQLNSINIAPKPTVTAMNTSSDKGPRVLVPNDGLFVPGPGPTKIVKIFTAQRDENGTMREEEVFVAIPSNSEAQHIGLQVKRLNIQTVFNRYWPAILGLTIGTAFLVAAVLTSVACRAQRLYIQRYRYNDQPQHLTEPPDTSEYSSSAASLVSDATRSSIRL